ncbi:unnamed protein product [Heterobilharzia americana]|nr:unnamed protein product [Heterobilharzia americana]
MQNMGQQRLFPEGWAKRVSSTSLKIDDINLCKKNKLNAFPEVPIDVNGVKRAGEAVDRVIETIQKKRNQKTGNSNTELYTNNSGQTLFKSSQSKIPSFLVQKSRVQRMIDDFLNKAKKRGLYTK